MVHAASNRNPRTASALEMPKAPTRNCRQNLLCEQMTNTSPIRQSVKTVMPSLNSIMLSLPGKRWNWLAKKQGNKPARIGQNRHSGPKWGPHLTSKKAINNGSSTEAAANPSIKPYVRGGDSWKRKPGPGAGGESGVSHSRHDCAEASFSRPHYGHDFIRRGQGQRPRPAEVLFVSWPAGWLGFTGLPGEPELVSIF